LPNALVGVQFPRIVSDDYGFIALAVEPNVVYCRYDKYDAADFMGNGYLLCEAGFYDL